MKKIFCIILSILILLSSFIITAFAAEENDISAFEEEIKKACQNGKNSVLRQIAENQFNKSDRFKDYINLYEGK